MEKFFPNDLTSIILSYLTYPELLQREEEDLTVKEILLQESFWKALLRERNIDLKGIENFRQEYQHSFVKDVIKEESFFLLGKLCLPLTRKDYTFLKQQSPFSLREFTFGCYLLNRKDLTRPLRKYIDDFDLRVLVSLHQGNKKKFREILHEQRLKTYSLDTSYYYTLEMIEHAIFFTIETPATVLPSICRVIGRNDDYLLLLNRFLQEHLRFIPEEALRREYVRLNNYVQLKKNTEFVSKFLKQESKDLPNKRPGISDLDDRERSIVLEALRCQAGSRNINHYLTLK